MIIIHCCRIVIWFAMKTSSMNGSYGVILTVALVFFPLIIITFLIIIITNKIFKCCYNSGAAFHKTRRLGPQPNHHNHDCNHQHKNQHQNYHHCHCHNQVLLLISNKKARTHNRRKLNAWLSKYCFDLGLPILG